MALLSGMGCAAGDGINFMVFPSIIVVDSVNGRVFVIDNQGNRLNLIDPLTNEVVPSPADSKEPLLGADEDPILLPAFPTNGAVAGLAGGLSRIFVIGGGGAPSQAITVLDYDGSTLVTSPISPIAVPAGSSTDILVGMVVDPVRGMLLVTNATTGMLHAFDVNSGVELPDSPVAIGGTPTRLSIDLDSGLLAVANTGNTLVSLLDLDDLGAPILSLDVGIAIRDVALVTNGNGTVLFLTGSGVNTVLAYVLDLADVPNSNQVFQLSGSPPNVPPPDPLLLTGSVNLVAAGNLSDGRVGSFYTQSTGDLFVLDVSNDLGSLAPAIVTIGATTGEGIAGLPNGAGPFTTVYFASPGLGQVTVVDPLTNEFIDQIQ